MATAASNPTPMKPRRPMREVKAPEMYKFSKQGQEISGVLINIEPTTVKGPDGRESHTIEYMLQDPENGTRLTFLGTNDLNKKLHPGLIGYFLTIRYERDDASFQKQGQSPAKIFKVNSAEEKEPGF